MANKNFTKFSDEAELLSEMLIEQQWEFWQHILEPYLAFRFSVDAEVRVIRESCFIDITDLRGNQMPVVASDMADFVLSLRYGPQREDFGKPLFTECSVSGEVCYKKQ